MQIKSEIIKLISEKIDGQPYASLENFALFVLQQKLLQNLIATEEKQVLINDFLSDYLEFDPETDEPVGKTDKIEKMIDFLLN